MVKTATTSYNDSPFVPHRGSLTNCVGKFDGLITRGRLRKVLTAT